MIMCEECKLRPSVAVETRGDGSARRLCWVCLTSTNMDKEELSRFFQLLAHPKEPKKPDSLPLLAPDIECPRCGLLYAEFCRIGSAGCESCYEAFEPAVKFALDSLRSAL